jgi:DNA repair protein RecN (Recombination protein N)
MLVQVTIRNLVLIERLVLDLGPGFNVLTGETGAGKSMLVDAISLVLGGRARPDMVRSGAREAEVEALFDLDAQPERSHLAAKLEAAGIPVEKELVVRRVVHAEGRSRAFVNGRMCTASQLADFAPGLCDIASQHESVSLTDPATHLGYLDAFGALDGARASLTAAVEALGEIARELEAARAAERGRAEREDFLSFQLREIEEVDPRAGEEGDLEIERARLRHTERLTDVTRRASERLYEAEGAICDELGRIAAELDGAAEIDATLADLARVVSNARTELIDLARVLARYADAVESNPQRLADVEERLFRLQKLLRKHGPELPAQRAQLARELESLAQASDRVSDLDARHASLREKTLLTARALSKKRRDAAERLADAIGRELGLLGMGRARVIVDVEAGERLMPTGIDRVEFLIAPNRGEEPRPLRRIASGGELSRALLALKRVLAEQGPAGLYVFDEVDAGVGGAIAEVIGRAIRDVARHRQVLCITHLPQIAALADAHFVVGKHETKGRTMTTARRLAQKDRVEELARMIGGVKVGDAAKRAAAEMLAARG